MAREQLNVTVVIFNNRSYAILNIELARVGAQPAGPRAQSQLDLSAPDLDFVKLGTGFGVPSCRVDDRGAARRGSSTAPSPSPGRT